MSFTYPLVKYFSSPLSSLDTRVGVLHRAHAHWNNTRWAVLCVTVTKRRGIALAVPAVIRLTFLRRPIFFVGSSTCVILRKQKELTKWRQIDVVLFNVQIAASDFAVRYGVKSVDFTKVSRKQRWFSDDSEGCNISLNYHDTTKRITRRRTKKRTGSPVRQCPKRNHWCRSCSILWAARRKEVCCKLIRKLGCSHRRASRFAGRVGVRHTTLSSRCSSRDWTRHTRLNTIWNLSRGKRAFVTSITDAG